MSHLLPAGRPAWAELTKEELTDKAHDAALAEEAGNAALDWSHAGDMRRDLPDQPGWAEESAARYADETPEPDFEALYEQHLDHKQEQRDGWQPEEAR